ncbi:ubiquinone biosynthesis protein UbiA [Halomicroarcula sp. F13]|uniref:Ubiquinone biosynthesis protein UbiA n=1 Tax=Haloarcula rubra TaxID=2487747 RepID=A0AAW4PY09_9EURY|nr:ubiquinone biosynthesis protein UbiA [Halomicroarcula rubra]MBX0325445.1 ubiquinone biosynthesis protein UbiA [Halomicroarcula rubra]
MARPLVGLAAHVRPVFMVPVVATSLCGALLAPSVSIWLGAQHAAAVGTTLYVAHLRDGLVDGHLRGEERPSLSVSTYRWATAVAVVVTLGLASSLAVTAGVLAVGSVLALLTLALLHAPYLDKHPVPVTVDYPVGIALTLAGGFATQTGRIPSDVIAAALSVAILLAGIKVGIDRLDAAFDRTVEKRTVPVIAGETGAKRIAVGCFTVSSLVLLGFVGVGVFPRLAAVAAVAAGGCAVATLVARPRWAVMTQMALSYVFVGSLFLALCGGRCAGWTWANRLVRTSAVGQIQLYLVGSGSELVEHFAFAPFL